MRYIFSTETVAEFYSRKFYSITNSYGELCAYSEKVFEVPEDVTLYSSNKTIIFEKAVLVKGVIRGGVIRGGVIRGGVIWGGEIRGGEIWGGVILGGEIWGGVIRGGVIRGGVIWGGVIWSGVIWGGEIRGGVIWSGEIRGGVIWGGEIWSGVIRGGVILGGEIRGGVILGGEILGGVIWGGVIWGGVIKVSMLQIQGSRHFCYASFTEDGKSVWLGIGCHFKSISEWIENYKSIGELENYSDSEIEEYSGYIEMFANHYAPELLKKKQSKKTV